MPVRKPFERLPKSVKPKHYKLVLTPDLKAFIFKGEVSIQIEVVKEVNEIVLNAVDLETNEITLQGNTEKLLSPQKIDSSPEDETLKLTFAHPIKPGLYILNIAFTGELNNNLKGLYRSKYVNEIGQVCYAAVTQFAATDARRCFPCWDEPALKATFDISLVVPPELVAVSNMPVIKSYDVKHLVRYDFATTPIMSTYLVSVVVGEYDYVEDHSADGVLVRVYTPPGKQEQGLFALEVATKVLPYYKDYFNIAYPLPKLDLIAVADFGYGAMENWGLITYRETCLLVDPQNTSSDCKQSIALTVGHEIAHQWFGNLVTMEWWTNLWLNEGYATFVEYLCVSHLFPEYDIWTQFINVTYTKALELDSLHSSHPIEVPVSHPSEVNEIFDAISYNKGASIIRMLHHYIGDALFRKGMNLYLTRHQYGNTFTEDLWAALEQASNKPVGAVMSTWTKQMGYPVVKVTYKNTENGVVLSFAQSKFCANGEQPKEEYLWTIPISVSTSKNPGEEVASTVLKTQNGELLLEGITDNDWIKVNPGIIGFYRTQYPSEMLERLIPAVQDQSLPPLDRLGLLDNLFALVQAGCANTVEVLKLMKAYENEVNFTVWASITNILSKIDILISYTDYEDAFRRYKKQLLSNVFKRLGWDAQPGEKHMDVLLRSLILEQLVWLDDEETVNEAKKRFENHIGTGPTLPADIRSACYKMVLRAGEIDIYSKMARLYNLSDLQEEKVRISRAMGAIKHPELLSVVTEFAISSEVRAQDTVFIIVSVAKTRKGRELAWKFVQNNWQLLFDRCQGGTLRNYLVKITENFASEEKAEETEKFFAETNLQSIGRAVQQSVENIRINAAWLQRDTEAIKDYLKSYV